MRQDIGNLEVVDHHAAANELRSRSLATPLRSTREPARVGSFLSAISASNSDAEHPHVLARAQLVGGSRLGGRADGPRFTHKISGTLSEAVVRAAFERSAQHSDVGQDCAMSRT